MSPTTERTETLRTSRNVIKIINQADLRYLSDRNIRHDTPNQMATAASQAAAVRNVLSLDDAL